MRRHRHHNFVTTLALDKNYIPMNEMSRRRAIKAVAMGKAVIVDLANFDEITFNPAISGPIRIHRVCLKASQVSLSSLNWEPRPAGAVSFARWAETALAVSFTRFCCSGVRFSR